MATSASVVVRMTADTAEFNTKLGQATRSAERFLTTLTQQNMTFGMSAERAQYYRLQLRGASEEVLRQIDSQIRLKESMIATARAKDALGSGDIFGAILGGSKFASSALKLFGLIAVIKQIDKAITDVRKNFEDWSAMDTAGILSFGDKLGASLVQSIPLVGRFVDEWVNGAKKIQEEVTKNLESANKLKHTLDDLAATSLKFNNAINPPTAGGAAAREIEQRYDAMILSLRRKAEEQPFIAHHILPMIETAELARQAELQKAANHERVKQSEAEMNIVNRAEQILEQKREELALLTGLTKAEKERSDLIFKYQGNNFQEEELRLLQDRIELAEAWADIDKAIADEDEKREKAAAKSFGKYLSEAMQEEAASLGTLEDLLRQVESRSAPSAALVGSREAHNAVAQNVFKDQQKPQIDILRRQLKQQENMADTLKQIEREFKTAGAEVD